MGVTITSKKGQLYVSFTANNQRKLFAVKPTVKATTDQLDTTTATVFTGNRKHDREINKILRRNLNWFIETVERLEKFEGKKATVPLIARLHQEEILANKKQGSCSLNSAFDSYIDHKRDIDGIKGNSLLQYSHSFRKRLNLFLIKHRYTHLDELDELFLNRFGK